MGTAFKFALPPRPSGGQPARAFRVMTMIGQVSNLWPRDQFQPASPPFEDTAITWTDASNSTKTTRFTGIVDHSNPMNHTGCVTRDTSGTCTQHGTLVPYRALRSATLTFSGSTLAEYLTAATVNQAPARVAVKGRSVDLGWTTSESVLP
jgi:hypothetical protein